MFGLTKKKVGTGFVVTACVALLANGVMGGEVFFSPSGDPWTAIVRTNRVNAHAGQQLTLYIWATDNQDYDTSIGINVLSSNPGEIAFTASEIFEPALISTVLGCVPNPPWPGSRWERGGGASGGTISADSVLDMSGVVETDGSGVKAENNGVAGETNPLGLLDEGYNIDAGAFLLGSVTMEVLNWEGTVLTMNQEDTTGFVNGGELVFPEFTPIGVNARAGPGHDGTFGDWARSHGYESGDAMPEFVQADGAGIGSLAGVGEFDWMTTPTISLDLFENFISNIEPGDFDGLTKLEHLGLGLNSLSSIDSGAFSGLTNLETLDLLWNGILGIEPGGFSGLPNLVQLRLTGNVISNIEPGAFNGLTSLKWLDLDGNQLSIVQSGVFSGLPNLEQLVLYNSEILSIESGAFSGLTSMTRLSLAMNLALEELNLDYADFSSLTEFDVGGDENVASISLRNAAVNQASLAAISRGVRAIDATITRFDLSGIDFVDITDLSPLYVMDDLTDVWLADTANVDATELDVLLNNLETIESPDVEGILYMTQADFDAFNTAGGGLLAVWNAEPGHHVEYLNIGDVNHDTQVNGLDVDPFIDVLLASRFDVAADINGDGAVNGLDVEPFVTIEVGGTQPVPEPSTLLLCIIALGIIGRWRRWR